MYRIVLKKKVIKFINSRPPKEKSRIREKFLALEQNPYPTNPKASIKKLTNRVGYRLRVGGYRFIYTVEEDELIILMIEADNRGDIY